MIDYETRVNKLRKIRNSDPFLSMQMHTCAARYWPADIGVPFFAAVIAGLWSATLPRVHLFAWSRDERVGESHRANDNDIASTVSFCNDPSENTRDARTGQMTFSLCFARSQWSGSWDACIIVSQLKIDSRILRRKRVVLGNESLSVS